MNLYKKCTAKPYSCLVIDDTLASDNTSLFRKNLLKRIWKIIMTIDHKIRDENLQWAEKQQAAKISALSSGKIDTGEEILPYNRRQIIEQARFAYSPLVKALGKQTERKFDALKSLNLSDKIDELKQIEGTFPKHMLIDLIIDKLKGNNVSEYYLPFQF